MLNSAFYCGREGDLPIQYPSCFLFFILIRRHRRHPSDFIFKQMLPLGHANEVKVLRGREGGSTLASHISLPKFPRRRLSSWMDQFSYKGVRVPPFRVLWLLTWSSMRRERGVCVLAHISLLFVTVSLCRSLPQSLPPLAPHPLLLRLLILSCIIYCSKASLARSLVRLLRCAASGNELQRLFDGRPSFVTRRAQCRTICYPQPFLAVIKQI